MLCSSPLWLGSCSTAPAGIECRGIGASRGWSPSWRWPPPAGTVVDRLPQAPRRPGWRSHARLVGALDPSPTSRQRVVHPVMLATRGWLDVRQAGLVLSPWTFHACNDVAGVHGAHTLRSRGRQLGCWQCSRRRITSSEHLPRIILANGQRAITEAPRAFSRPSPSLSVTASIDETLRPTFPWSGLTGLLEASVGRWLRFFIEAVPAAVRPHHARAGARYAA